MSSHNVSTKEFKDQGGTFDLTGVNIEGTSKIEEKSVFFEKKTTVEETARSQKQNVNPSRTSVINKDDRREKEKKLPHDELAIKREVSIVKPDTSSNQKHPLNNTNININTSSSQSKALLQFKKKMIESKTKLPPVTIDKSKKSILRASTSQSQIGRGTQKLEKLSKVLEEMKTNQNKEKKDTRMKSSTPSYNVSNILDLYENRIVDDYNKLYSSKDPKSIFNQLKYLERNKFLQDEMTNKESETEQEKQKCNYLTHKIKNQEKKLFQLDELLKKLEQELPQTKITEIYSEKVGNEKILKKELYNEKIKGDSLAYMLQNRKVRKKSFIVYKKKCTEIFDELKDVQVQLDLYTNAKNKRKEKKFEMTKNIMKFTSLEKYSSERLGPKFQDLLYDELSIFEENRAVREIFKHEEELEREKERIAEEERRAELMRQKTKREKENDEIRKKRKIVEEELREKKMDFDRLRKVTNVTNVENLPKHKVFLEECKDFLHFDYNNLINEVNKEKENIEALEVKLNTLKFNAKSNNETKELKIDELERNVLEENNLLQDKAFAVEKTERVIDQVCTSISRMLYQLQGKSQKFKNVEVEKKNLLNSLSVLGLKLERILTILYKKQKDFQIDELEIENNNDIPPDQIGLNSRVYVEPQEKPVDEDNDELYINKDSQSEIDYFENERTSVKQTKEEKEKIAKAILKENFKEAKMLKSLP